MQNLLLMIVTVLSVNAQATAAKVSTINCPITEEMEGNTAIVTVEFLVKNLGLVNAELMAHPKANPETGVILVTPEEVGDHATNMVNLNSQGGDLRVGSDRIRLFGDGDGYTFVDLVLFKNSNYKEGYVRVYGSGDQSYQKIKCTVK